MTTPIFADEYGSLLGRWEMPIEYCGNEWVYPTPWDPTTLTTIAFNNTMVAEVANVNEFDDSVDATHEALIKIPNLRNLKLSFTRWSPAAWYQNMPAQFERFIHPRNDKERSVWPKLERLSPTWMGMDADYVLHFLEQNTNLKFLELEHMMLIGRKLLEGRAMEDVPVNPGPYPYYSDRETGDPGDIYQLDEDGG
ncbi:uncharacterized protein BDZ99DRAFT_527278 [Mytilinidion resinicola]|uniref:Uncharacterized protein n=1 Tax=Mytilinidion resinicola TaxID=574789 RepID=A0A6A6Y1A4_9PEZI|nr:uncharacterized protein BDZ99DRAFT_527278 [Mytilinidion resinicola]KAF2802552.1 hypothetical protein BDZ99DRAFT_527278 [Mytilinidion resinicola]